MNAEELFAEVAEVLKERRTLPHGPAASPEDAKVAGFALVKLIGGDRDKARTIWKMITERLGYMPKSVCIALVHASSDNVVPDVTAPDPS